MYSLKRFPVVLWCGSFNPQALSGDDFSGCMFPNRCRKIAQPRLTPTGSSATVLTMLSATNRMTMAMCTLGGALSTFGV